MIFIDTNIFLRFFDSWTRKIPISICNKIYVAVQDIEYTVTMSDNEHSKSEKKLIKRNLQGRNIKATSNMIN